MILEWNSVAKRQFHMEWKTKWLVRVKCRFDNCSRPQRAAILLDSIPHEDRHSGVPRGVRLRESWLCLFADDIQHSLSSSVPMKQTNKKKTPSSEWVSTQQPQTVRLRSLFRPYESGGSGWLNMPSYVNRNGNSEPWTRTKLSNSVTVITNLR